jgi:HEAT repeat protein
MEASVTARGLAAAIAGLGEVGAASDAQSAGPFLSHPSAAVRRAAVKCVMRLSAEAFAERVTAMLTDASRSVSAAARNALRRNGSTLRRSVLTDIFATSTSRHTRLNVVPLFAGLSKWESITCLINVATVDDEEVASLARRYVREWNKQYNRNQTLPSRREIQELTGVLATAGTALDRNTAEVIWFSVRSFS